LQVIIKLSSAKLYIDVCLQYMSAVLSLGREGADIILYYNRKL